MDKDCREKGRGGSRHAHFPSKAILVMVGLLVFTVWAAAQEPAGVWAEFVGKLKSGTLTAVNIRSEYTTPEQQLVWLKQLKEASDARKSWTDWEAKPEFFRVGDHVQVVARVHDGTRYLTLCLTFLIEERRWYYSHMENIFIRLDQIGPPPVALFPDIEEETKAWMREETYWSTFIGGVYAPLVKEKGAAFVFNLLKRGGPSSSGCAGINPAFGAMPSPWRSWMRAKRLSR
jgi:hypothetical protein